MEAIRGRDGISGWEWEDKELSTLFRIDGKGLRFQPLGQSEELKPYFWVRVPTRLVSRALKHMPSGIPATTVILLVDDGKP